MPFKKWSGIENSYNSKFIEKYIDKFPALLKEKFVVTEKIDGSCMSIIFTPDGNFQFAKRNGLIEGKDNFYNYKKIMVRDFSIDELDGKEFKNATQEKILMGKFIRVVMPYYCAKHNKTIQLIGELYGKGVQKRIYYGEEVHIKFFGIYEHINGEVKNYTQEEVIDFFGHMFSFYGLYMLNLMPPILAKKISLKEALDFNIDFQSKLTPDGYDKDNFAEGIVIRPMSDNYEWGCENFIIKIKNEKFEDRPPKKQKQAKVLPDEVKTLIEEATLYVNRNRTLDLYSKHGKFDEMKKFGEYIKLYIEDVLEDFHKEYPLEMDKLSKDERKSLGKAIVGKIREELKETM